MNEFLINNRRYLGSKYSLIKDIQDSIDITQIKSVADIFGGTGVVGESFASKGKKVIINDILYSNTIIYKCFFGKGYFNKNKLLDYIKRYNSLNSNEIEENYFSINFSETYFNKSNCKKIGFIREDIENELKNNNINKREYYILITSLIYAIDKIANTVGHYDAYRENKEDLNKKFELIFPHIKEYKEEIKIYREDANELVKKKNADLIYIDPPYNSRQYCDMYHLLENLAEWKKPNVYFKAKKMNRKHIKSKYSQKEATEAFRDLIENIEAKFIIVSYNNTGNKGAERSKAKISDEDIINILKQKGDLKIVKKEYNMFTTGRSEIEDLNERLFICKVNKNKITIKKEVKSKNNKLFIKPPTNYTGSKYKHLEQMFKFFPNDIENRTFIDMFSGGLSVGINVNAKKIICNDKETSLIRLYRLFEKYSINVIMKNIDRIIKKYKLSDVNLNGYEYYGCESSSGVGSYNKEKYTKLKNCYNNSEVNEEKDYMFFVLLIFAFNNQIRFNSKNEFNMPVGKRDFNKNIRKNLINTVEAIKRKNIEFLNKDFREIDIYSYKNPILYCDPPYILTNAAYNENGGWSEKDELDLLDKLKKFSDNGGEFILSNVLEHSNKKHNLLIEWIIKNKYNVIHINKNYKNSSYHKKDKKSESDEVLITNFI